MAMNDPHDIRFSIDELVIHGIPGVRSAPLERAFRHELARLLVEGPIPRPPSSPIERSGPLEVRVAGGASSGAVGRQIAHAVHGALRRP